MCIAQIGLTVRNGGERAANQISSTCKKMTHPQRDQHLSAIFFSSFLIPSLFPLDIIHIVFPKALWSSLMASSTFKVVPALESDMVDISSIFTVSFADDHILGPANGNVALDLLRAVDLEFMNELWRTRDAFNAKFFKVVDLDTRSEPRIFILTSSYPFLFFFFSCISVQPFCVMKRPGRASPTYT